MAIKKILSKKVPDVITLSVLIVLCLITAWEFFIFSQVRKEIANLSMQYQELIRAGTDSHGCLVGAGYSWCELKQKCLKPQEEKCEGQEAVNFDKTGNLVNRTADKDKNSWVLVYEEPGKPALEAGLLFDENNPCVYIPGENPCSPDRLETGQRARVEGSLEEGAGKVRVKWIYIIQ